MNPQEQFCPNSACPARGRVGDGNIGIHSRKEKRYKCKVCRKTFGERSGTVYYRLRHGADVVTIVVALLANGCPTQAIVAAYGLDERTVTDWQERAGRHSQAVQEHLVQQPRELEHVQADEIRVKAQGRVLWVAMAMMVSTRLWLGGVVSQQRNLHLITQLMAIVRACALARPLLIVVDGLVSYITATQRVFRTALPTGKAGRPRLIPWPDIHIGQVVKQYQGKCVVAVVRRMAQGCAVSAQKLVLHSRGGQQLNTAFIERLNATFRARLAPLARRSRCLVRTEATLYSAMYLVGAVYNFCTYHKSLRVSGVIGGKRKWLPRTPAMAAGIADHCWTVQELLSYRVPPPPWTPPKRRGRPSNAMKQLQARWCS
jgi:transposase-like protein